jgi:trigger factor
VLNTSVERLEGTNVKLTVTVSADEVDAAISASYTKLGAKVRVPGFRKGKAPRTVVDNYVGREYVLAEATEDLVNDTYPRAADGEGLRTVDAPEMGEIETVVAGEEYTYTATVELRPELTLTSTDDFAVSVPSKEASEAEVDMQVAMMQDRFATLEPVADRALAADDFALISFVGYVDGEPYEGNEVDKYLYEMGQGLMPLEFDAGIVGLEVGGEKRIEFAIPDTSSNPEFIGKTAQFDVTVHEIKAKVLPALDDEFASNMGFETIEEMRTDMRTRMGVQKLVAHDREKERAVKAQLAERLEGDVPEAMVRQRTGTMLRDFQAMLEQRDMTIDAYLQATGVEAATLEKDISEQAAQSAKEDLALEALFRAKGMEVTDADIDEELKTVADGTESTPEEARARWEEMGLLPVITEQIMHLKAVGWLMENATVTETTDVDAAASDEE